MCPKRGVSERMKFLREGDQVAGKKRMDGWKKRNV
jgi:hypothetical protein